MTEDERYAKLKELVDRDNHVAKFASTKLAINGLVTDPYLEGYVSAIANSVNAISVDFNNSMHLAKKKLRSLAKNGPEDDEAFSQYISEHSEQLAGIRDRFEKLNNEMTGIVAEMGTIANTVEATEKQIQDFNESMIPGKLRPQEPKPGLLSTLWQKLKAAMPGGKALKQQPSTQKKARLLSTNTETSDVTTPRTSTSSTASLHSELGVNRPQSAPAQAVTNEQANSAGKTPPPVPKRQRPKSAPPAIPDRGPRGKITSTGARRSVKDLASKYEQKIAEQKQSQQHQETTPSKKQF